MRARAANQKQLRNFERWAFESAFGGRDVITHKHPSDLPGDNVSIIQTAVIKGAAASEGDKRKTDLHDLSSLIYKVYKLLYINI